MLKAIYSRYAGPEWESKYNSFDNQLKTVESCLRNRRKLTSLYSAREVQEAIDTSIDALIEVREMQRQIEKISIFVKREKKITETDMYLDKEEKRIDFISIADDLMMKYRGTSTKKSMTTDERKNLFRVYHKDFYKEMNRKSLVFEEWLEFLNDERNNLLNIRNELQSWQSILRKKLYEN